MIKGELYFIISFMHMLNGCIPWHTTPIVRVWFAMTMLQKNIINIMMKVRTLRLQHCTQMAVVAFALVIMLLFGTIWKKTEAKIWNSSAVNRIKIYVELSPGKILAPDYIYCLKKGKKITALAWETCAVIRTSYYQVNFSLLYS